MKHVDRVNPSGDRLLTAREAMRLLGVKASTLYAYVSRGLLRTAPGSDRRSRLYVREDVDRLRARSQARRGHGVAAAGALRWGEPVLESAITEIAAGELRYRGMPVLALASGRTSFESVAEFLWTGVLPRTPVVWDAPPRSTRAAGLAGALGADATRLQWLAALRDSALKKMPASDRSPPLTAGLMAFAVAAFALSQPPETPLLDALLVRARHLIGFLAGRDAPKSGRSPPTPGIASSLVHSLSARKGRATRDEDAAVRAVDMALILCADHELNASTFAARVAASTGADLYACFLSALGAMSGPRHGGVADDVEQLLASLPNGAARLKDKVAQRLRAGVALPGFGHTLYPNGDPRAEPLLERARELASDHPDIRKLVDLQSAVADLTGEKASLDLGLVALATALGLGSGGALAMFALGRTAGWTAHVIEQRQQNVLLRPRARYVGVARVGGRCRVRVSAAGRT